MDREDKAVINDRVILCDWCGTRVQTTLRGQAEVLCPECQKIKDNRERMKELPEEVRDEGTGHD